MLNTYSNWLRLQNYLVICNLFFPDGKLRIQFALRLTNRKLCAMLPSKFESVDGIIERIDEMMLGGGEF